MFFKQSSILLFHFLSINHIVLILSCDRLMKVIFLTNLNGCVNPVSIPVAGSPVKGVSFLDNLMETSNNFFNWSVFIKTMGENNVNIIKLKSLKRWFDAFFNVLPVGATFWVDALVRRIPKFGCDNQPLSGLFDLF